MQVNNAEILFCSAEETWMFFSSFTIVNDYPKSEIHSTGYATCLLIITAEENVCNYKIEYA